MIFIFLPDCVDIHHIMAFRIAIITDLVYRDLNTCMNLGKRLLILFALIYFVSNRPNVLSTLRFTSANIRAKPR